MLASILALCLLGSIHGHSLAGEEFYLMFMPNVVETAVDSDMLTINVINAEFDSSVTVDVSMPLDNRMATMTRLLDPLESFDFIMPVHAMHRFPGTFPLGIYVNTTGGAVTVTGYNKQKFSVDSFLGIPRSSLGISYSAACFTSNIRTQIGIVATLDNTRIQITLPERTTVEPYFPVEIEHAGEWYDEGETFEIVLNKHESYLMATRGDLTATQIRSNKRISVFSGNVRAKLPTTFKSRDHLVEQLIPFHAWGRTYYAARTGGRTTRDMYRVLAKNPGTVVTATATDGTILLNNVPISSINTFVQVYTIYDTVEFICSDDCLVYEISSSTDKSELGDPSMTQLVAIENFVHGFYFKTPKNGAGQDYEHYITFVSDTDQDLFLFDVDGNVTVLNLNWIQATPASSYYVATYKLEYSEIALDLWSGNLSRLVGAVMSGNSDRESYAHPIGLQYTSPACLANRAVIIPGDGLDNDCDGRIDEEILDGMDDDNDGLIDEDTQFTRSGLSTGREYVIMFMENTVEEPHDIDMEVFVASTVNVPTEVSIMYTIGGVPMVNNFTLGAGLVHKENISNTIMQIGTSLDTDKVVRVFTSEDVAVYGMNKNQFSADGFLALPTATLGQEYFTVNYYPPTNAAEFAIIALEDDTEILIRFPALTHIGEDILVTWNAVQRTNGDSITLTMGALESLQMQDENQGDLSGTYISASRPIAVFSGNIRTFVDSGSGSSRDHLVEQLPPLQSYGVTFALMTTPNKENNGDCYRIVASTDDTDVHSCLFFEDSSTTECFTETITSAGCHIDRCLNQSHVYQFVTANKPVLTVMITRSNKKDSDPFESDPAMFIIPPLEQWSNEYTFSTPTASNQVVGPYTFHELMVIIETAHRDDLILNGNTTLFSGIEWHLIPGGVYSAGHVRIDDGLYHLSHSNASVAYMGLLYGAGNRESYGFPIALKLDILNICVEEDQVPGDGKDNDCDRRIDEEICGNGIDDDQDGLEDEDCIASPTNVTYLAVFMQNDVEDPIDFPLRLYSSSFETQHVRIWTPTYVFSEDGSTYDHTQAVDSGNTLNFGFRPDIRAMDSQLSNKTIVVYSDHELDIYAMNKEKWSADAFLVFPAECLGTEYYTMHYDPSTMDEEFAIASLSDDTSVTVTFTTRMNKVLVFLDRNGASLYNPGDVCKFDINVGETAQFQGSQLSGTLITSDKRIAVFSGNVRTGIEGTSRDHLVDQLLPVTSWSDEYYVPVTPNRTTRMDVLRMFSKVDCNITVSDGASSMMDTLTGGVVFERELSSPDAAMGYKLASNCGDFQAVRFTKSQRGKNDPEKADPSMVLVMPQSLWKTKYRFALPISSGVAAGGEYVNFAQLIVPTVAIDGLLLDDKALPPVTWYSIDASMSTANIDLPSDQKVEFSLTNEVPFGAYLYGSTDRESYALPLGIRKVDLK